MAVLVELRQTLIRVPGPSVVAGSVIDVPDDEGRRFCDRRIAVPATDRHPATKSQRTVNANSAVKSSGGLKRETR